MNLSSRLFGRKNRIVVRVLLRGRIGEGWHDVDRELKVPAGIRLDELLDVAEGKGIPLRQAIAQSPHLRDTLMLNGERCALEEHGERVLEDGDQIYLLAPVAGG